jgi:hypothetical protein
VYYLFTNRCSSRPAKELKNNYRVNTEGVTNLPC